MLTGLTVTATQMDFGSESLTRVSCCIDAPGNGLTTTREVPISFICVDLSRLAAKSAAKGFAVGVVFAPAVSTDQATIFRITRQQTVK